jgi:uncharacterized membrane protein YedE/YeeE
MLLLNDATVWHWAVTGAVVGLVTLALQFFANRALGVSTGLEDLCSLASRAPYFQRPEVQTRWRLPFLAGLVLGGLLAALQTGGWQPTWSAGMLDSRLHLGIPAKVAWYFAGGLLIGFGTRLAGGCTSGHGIYGMSRMQPASLLSTCAFMGAGVVFANVLWRVLA